MRLSAAQFLPNRHVMRDLIADVSWGNAAETTLPALTDITGMAVALLPTHMKVLSDTKTGTRLVDAFISWEAGTVLAIPAGEIRTVGWSYVEHGRRHSHSTTFTVDASANLTVTGDYPEQSNDPVVHTLFSTRGRDRLLTQLTRAAENSEWALTSELERYVLFSLESANRRIAREIEGDIEDVDITDYYADRDNNSVVDRIALEKISGQLLFGDDGAKGTSVVRRMILRCATTPINNQPIPSYLATNIYSQAELHIRREIGDPHIGRKVRRVARDAGAVSIDELLAAYRLAHPKDELGKTRAIAAMTAGKTLDATSTAFEQWSVAKVSDGQ